MLLLSARHPFVQLSRTWNSSNRQLSSSTLREVQNVQWAFTIVRSTQAWLPQLGYQKPILKFCHMSGYFQKHNRSPIHPYVVIRLKKTNPVLKNG